MERLATNPCLGHNEAFVREIIRYTESFFINPDHEHTIFMLLAYNPSMPAHRTLAHHIRNYLGRYFLTQQKEREIIYALAVNPAVGHNEFLLSTIIAYIDNLYYKHDKYPILGLLSMNHSTCNHHRVTAHFHRELEYVRHHHQSQLAAAGAILVAKGIIDFINYLSSE